MHLFYTLTFALFLFTPLTEKSSEIATEEDLAFLAPGEELTDDGSTVRIDYSGTHEDFAIPADTDVEVLTFFLMGGDGGTRNVCGDAAKGGRGARVDLSFRIGSEAGKLEPGGIIRFIVGQDGANQNSNSGGGAGGGGGTAILYASPRADTATFDDVPSLDLADADNDWVILAVAGGGGGSHGRAPDSPFSFAVNGPCVRGASQDGRGASEETYGGTGSNFNSIVERVGGEEGEGGKSRADRGGGAGGGYLGDGEGEEATGGGHGGITGGAGGVDNSGISARGGFGYGGGGTGYARSGSFGGGGGGGGFSGGNGGNAPNGGGGGGSFVNPAAIIQDNSIQGGRATTNPVHGFITYQFFVLQDSGEEAHVPYIGSYRDLMIPTDLDLSQFDGIAFSMRGGDGGRAISTENGILRARGGKGAFVSLKFPLGDNPNQLRRGGTLRFIVGSEGSSNRSKRATGAGGGGGTAILYRPPGLTGDGDCVVSVPGAPQNQLPAPSFSVNDDCWTLLAVAGGGGGGFAFNNRARDGKPGNDATNGTDGNDDNDGAGGINGNSGEASGTGSNDNKPGGGGGGYRPVFGDLAEAQGVPGVFEGGSGGTSEGRFLRGGYGYGGGGSGTNGDNDTRTIASSGGGGGYSGGGGSRRDGGGGGGSFANDLAFDVAIDKRNIANTPSDGFIKYQLFKRETSDIVVSCVTDYTVQIFGTERSGITPDSVLIEAYDPEDSNAALDFEICTPTGNTCVDRFSFGCGENLRTRELILNARNGTKEGACRFTVTIEQLSIDTLICPDPLIVEANSCEVILTNNQTFISQIINLQPALRPACNDSLAYNIVRPDGSVDTSHVEADLMQGIAKDTFEIGLSTVNYFAYYEDIDGVPQAQACSFNVTINPPEVNDFCPNNLGVNIDPGVCASVIQHESPDQELEADLPLNADCAELTYRVIYDGFLPDTTEGSGQLSSFEFQIGNSRVEYFLDYGGGAPQSCSFNVTVMGEGDGNSSLSIDCPRDISIPVSELTTEREIFDQVVTLMGDACGITDFNIRDLSIDCNRAGREQRNVTFELLSFSTVVEDCRVDVTLLDEVGITCPDNAIIPVREGECVATFRNNLPQRLGDYLCFANLSYAITGGPSGQELNIPKTPTNMQAPLNADYPPGDYIFTYFADLSDGSQSSDCSFTVSIADTEAPVAICSSIEVIAGESLSNLGPLIGVNSSDNCEIETFNLIGVPEQSDCNSTGLYPVSLEVVDAAGNSDKCNGILKITSVASGEDIEVAIDSMGQISISIDQVYADDLSDCTVDEIEVELTPPVDGSDADPVMAIASNQGGVIQNLMITCSELGENEYTLTLTDVNGAISSLNGTIVVKDDIGPTFSCPLPMEVTTSGESACQVEIPNFADLVMDEADNCSLGTNVLEQSIPAGPYTPSTNTFEVALSLSDVSDNLDGENCVVSIVVIDFDSNPICAPVVPVELLFFNAKKLETNALLEWNTANEVNNKGFSIERSADALSWKTIGFVQGNGTTTRTQDYQWIDKKPLSGQNYYRLKQVDFDGSFTYSQIEELNFTSGDQNFQVFPNPTKDILNVKWEPSQKVTGMKVYSIFGEVILQYAAPAQEILTNDLPSGLYWLVLETEQGQMKQRFVKQ